MAFVILHFFMALIFTVLISIVFVNGFRNLKSRIHFRMLFLLIFLFTWAGGIWRWETTGRMKTFLLSFPRKLIPLKSALALPRPVFFLIHPRAAEFFCMTWLGDKRSIDGQTFPRVLNMF